MDKSKVKNFILILLALVNIFLLIIVIKNATEEKKAESSRMQALGKILEEDGIALSPDTKLPETVPPTLSLKRDMNAELHRVSSLIGKCSVEEQAGNIFIYKGNDGEARFRGTGEFEIILYSGIIKMGKDSVGAAKTALRKLGIKSGDTEPVVTVDSSNTIVELCCTRDGMSIYNAIVSVKFMGDNIYSISGTLPFDTKNAVKSSENYPDSITILMGFLESRNQKGYNEITDIKIGYNIYPTVSGSCTLIPIWYITTNSGSYQLDAETGESENIDNLS